jgi:type VI secretion system secreted protein VgrG
MAALSQERRVASLTTPLGENALALTRFDAGEGISEIFEYRIEAISEEPRDVESIIGQHCTVTLSSHTGEERFFDGLLVDTQYLGLRNVFHVYRLVLKPWTWLLTRTTDSETFQDMTAPDIVQKIFSDNGLSDFRMSLTESYPTLEYSVQYRETDLAYISRLMEQHGIYYFFEHEKGKHTMVLADAKSSHQRVPGQETIEFIPVLENQRSARNHLYRLTGQRKLRSGKLALNDYDPLKPNADLLVNVNATEDYTHGQKEYYDFPGEYTERSVGEKYAKVRLEAEQALDKRRHVAGDAVSLFPGGLVKVEKHPDEAENVEHLVVRSAHSFVSRDYRTAAEDAPPEDVYSGNYEFLPSDQVFRAPLLTERPVIHGAQTAKVVCKNGEEIDVDKHGRITVQFFWDRNKTTSIRVRVAQVWAGKGWGGLFIPRVDQEVVVVFLEGDPDRPLVVGAVYNGDNTVPYELEAMKTWNGIKSDSTKGGGGYNEWVFQDKKGSEMVRGHAQKDLEFTIRNNEKWDIGVNSDTTVGQTLTITAGTKIELKVGANQVVIDGTGVTIKGVAKIDANSPMTTVQGTGILTLQGGLVKIN